MTHSFFAQVYELVQQIPPGKVMTYGSVARALGSRDARRVGHALHANPSQSQTPCHRVVNAEGRLAPGFAFGGPGEQRRLLEQEGVAFIGELVDLKTCLWSPRI